MIAVVLVTGADVFLSLFSLLLPLLLLVLPCDEAEETVEARALAGVETFLRTDTVDGRESRLPPRAFISLLGAEFFLGEL